MSTASDLERQMLALINAERTSRGYDPVQLELRLNESAEDHSDWMLRTDNFSHTGSGGSSAGDRMRDAGFQFSGSWTWAENIAWQSVRGAPGLSDDVQNLHDALMNSSGHRANILNPDVTVIGIGIETGNFDGWDAIMVTQNFAHTSASLQLDNDDASGGGGGNTGADTPPPPPPSSTEPPVSSDPVKKTVSGTKTGTDGDDWLVVKKGAAGKLIGLDGDDILVGSSRADKLHGSSGNDILKGGSGNDKLHSGSGNDKSSGGSGNDLIDGDGGSDRLLGGNGKDKLIGGLGDDWLHGGRDTDRLLGGDDADTLIGYSGNDRLWGQEGDDILKGGGGKDKLSGGSGDDILSGGSNADVFIFSTGTDRVVDFSSADLVYLRKVDTISSYSDLKNNHMTQSESDVVIDDGLGNYMILEDTRLSDLDKGDFIL